MHWPILHFKCFWKKSFELPVFLSIIDLWINFCSFRFFFFVCSTIFFWKKKMKDRHLCLALIRSGSIDKLMIGKWVNEIKNLAFQGTYWKWKWKRKRKRKSIISLLVCCRSVYFNIIIKSSNFFFEKWYR